MLRISTRHTPGSVTLHLEGKLLTDWCPEVRQACQRSAQAGLPIRLDLAALSFADAAGVREIRHALSRGVTLGPCSNFIAALLETERT